MERTAVGLMLRAAATVIALTTGVYGLVRADMNDTVKLKVTFSQRDTNRITVGNGRIAQVFGVEEVMSIQFDEENGQCFVKAKANPGYPVTLTLVTEEGETQDVEITFADTASEVVLLHSLQPFNIRSVAEGTEASAVVEAAEEAEEGANNIKMMAVGIVKQLLRRQIPKGFREIDAEKRKDTNEDNNRDNLSLMSGLTLRYEKFLVGGGVEEKITRGGTGGTCERIEVILGTVTNTSNDHVKVRESQLAGSHDVAVYLSQSDLSPRQSATLIIIRKRG